LPACLEGLSHALCGSIFRFKLERLTNIGSRSRGLVCLKIETGEHEIGGSVWMKGEGRLGLGARFGCVPAAFTDLSETRVGGGTGGIGGKGSLELLLRFGDQSLRKIVMAKLGVARGPFGGRKRCHAVGTHLIELKGRLAKGSFGVVAANALEGREV
jgi:hypothetical protein